MSRKYSVKSRTGELTGRSTVRRAVSVDNVASARPESVHPTERGRKGGRGGGGVE